MAASTAATLMSQSGYLPMGPTKTTFRQASGSEEEKWLQVALAGWDKGSRNSRLKTLTQFINKNRNKTGVQMEKDYGHELSLFLTRVSAWLRLCYVLYQPVGLILQAISILLGGDRFLLQFCQVGGATMVLEILGQEKSTVDDKKQVLLILLTMAAGGRSYKELICENHGIDILCFIMVRSSDERAQELCQNVLTDLGRDNPRFGSVILKVLVQVLASQEKVGALLLTSQVVRALLSGQGGPACGPALADSTIAAALRLLACANFQVQYEGSEILKNLIHDPFNRDKIMNGLIGCLIPVAEASGGGAADAPKCSASGDRRGIFARGKGEGGWTEALASQQEHWHRSEDFKYTQQAAAAKFLGQMADAVAEDNKWMREKLTGLECVTGLLYCVANATSVAEPRKQGARTLMIVLGLDPQLKETVKHYVGNSVANLMQLHGEKMFEHLKKAADNDLHKYVQQVRSAQAQDKAVWQVNPPKDLSAAAPADPNNRRSRIRMNRRISVLENTLTESDNPRMDRRNERRGTIGPGGAGLPPIPGVNSDSALPGVGSAPTSKYARRRTLVATSSFLEGADLAP